MPERDYRERLNRLQAAADDAARHVRNVYLTFMLVSLYAALMFGTVSDEQLLRVSDLTLPLLNVGLPIDSVFAVGPAIYLVLHFNLLLQIHLLSRKLFALDAVINGAPWGISRAEQRVLLFPLAIAHRIAEHRESGIVTWLIDMVVLLTVLAMPVSIIAGAQLRFLPYHSEPITFWHQTLLAVQLVIIWILWPSIFFDRGSGWISGMLRGDLRPLTTLVPAVSFSLVIVVLSTIVAVVPGGTVERWVTEHAPTRWVSRSGDSLSATNWLFDRPDSWFHRDLRLSGKSLGSGIPPLFPGLPDSRKSRRESLSIRGDTLLLARRDLRNADLRGATLINFNLRGANLRSANLHGATLIDVQLQDADLRGAYLGSATLSNSALSGADLRDTDLKNADLRRQNFAGATLRGADFRNANLSGSNFDGLTMHRVELRGAKLRGATLNKTDLHGVSLENADLRGASLRGARLQGTNLRHAKLQGTDLTEAELQASDLTKTVLIAALMVGADMRATNLDGAYMYLTNLTRARLCRANFHAADIDFVNFNYARFPCDGEDKLASVLKWVRAQVGDDDVFDGVRETIERRYQATVPEDSLSLEGASAVAVVYKEAALKNKRVAEILADWPKSSSFEDYTERLAQQLARISCEDVYIARSTVRRIRTRGSQGMVPNWLESLARDLLQPSCVGSEKLSPELRRGLRRVAAGKSW